MTTGTNKVNEYLSRVKDNNGQITVFCKHCETWHDSDNFHKSRGRYKSICKDCHRSRYSVANGYRSPATIEASKLSKQKKEAWLSENQTCTNCGSTKPRREFYNERQKAYLPYCCSNRRTWDQIEIDIKEQMKTCFECELRLPFDEFSYNPNGRDKKRPYCKCCEAAKAKIYSDQPDRVEQIKDTDDGTITIAVLSSLLRETSHCSHCGVRMTQSYPVTPSNKTIDHDVPLSRGGKHTINNISVMCLGCNSSKQARTLDEFSTYVKKKQTVK